MLFFTQLFTSQRGALAKIWLAAHWERKLTKANVFECNLETTIRDIISPKMKIGLRTSGHLLLGVVRIYSRKAKYLLADCSDALQRIKVAFRPGQTDMPLEGLEATLKAITLIEDFTAFDGQLPPLSDIDVGDHFSLNQSRLEDITLKEDFGSGFLNLTDNRVVSRDHQKGLLDVSLHSFTEQGDGFGDEDNVFDLIDFLTSSSDPAVSNDLIFEEPQNENPENSTLRYQQGFDDAEMDNSVDLEVPSLNETILIVNEEEAFALEPVTRTQLSATSSTTNTQRKKGKRKRKLAVDQTKELSNETIRKQLSDYKDLLAPLDMAPPTEQLMHWKESGSADKVFTQTCSAVVNPQIRELYFKSIFQARYVVCEEVEDIRHDGQEVEKELSTLTTDISVNDSTVNTERAHSSDLTFFDEISTCNNECETYSPLTQAESQSEFTYPELPSEDSMFVHPSHQEQQTQSDSLNTQSVLDSQAFVERRTTRHAQELLDSLKSQSSSDTMFSLETLCKGSTRLQAATTFFSLLVLKKRQAIQLHQHVPYEDIFVSPGPKFDE